MNDQKKRKIKEMRVIFSSRKFSCQFDCAAMTKRFRHVTNGVSFLER